MALVQVNRVHDNSLLDLYGIREPSKLYLRPNRRRRHCVLAGDQYAEVELKRSSRRELSSKT
jgi:hypothetical protein